MIHLPALGARRAPRAGPAPRGPTWPGRRAAEQRQGAQQRPGPHGRAFLPALRPSVCPSVRLSAYRAGNAGERSPRQAGAAEEPHRDFLLPQEGLGGTGRAGEGRAGEGRGGGEGSGAAPAAPMGLTARAAAPAPSWDTGSGGGLRGPELRNKRLCSRNSKLSLANLRSECLTGAVPKPDEMPALLTAERSRWFRKAPYS